MQHQLGLELPLYSLHIYPNLFSLLNNFARFVKIIYTYLRFSDLKKKFISTMVENLIKKNIFRATTQTSNTIITLCGKYAHAAHSG